MKVLVPLAIGCGLVGVVAVVLAIVGWDWTWLVSANTGSRRCCWCCSAGR